MVALFLLLCTDAAWSWWFASGIDHLEGGIGHLVEIGHTRSETTGRQDTRIVYHWTSRAWSVYGTIRNDFQWPDVSAYQLMYPGETAFNDVAPIWVRAVVDRASPGEEESGRAEHRFASVGWPVRVLWIGVRCDQAEDVLVPWTGAPLSHEVPVAGVFHRLAPLRPIWTGQAANLVFWAAVIVSLRAGLGIARRRWRRWHGLCAGCGYDVRGCSSGACSECGLAFASGDPPNPE